MKIEINEEKMQICFNDDAEYKRYNRWRIEVWNMMPSLFNLLQKQPLILTNEEFREKRRSENLWTAPSLSAILVMQRGYLALITNKRLTANRRDIDGHQSTLDSSRTVLAGLKILCFIPCAKVLEQEKAWRIREYLRAMTGKTLASAMRTARYRRQEMPICV